jgi:hypothetical protein
MKKTVLVLFAMVFWAQGALAAELQEFLKDCAYGTLAGAMVGVVSVAVSDKPSEHGSNIAKGASLGLYAGIVYGLVEINQKPQTPNTDPYATLSPQYHEGRVDGASLVMNFPTF